MTQIIAVQEAERVDWRHRAACRAEDPELFFPVATTGPKFERQVAEAKAVCRVCTVASTCLSWALDTGQDAGVWGGMNEDERRAVKRRALKRRAASGGSGVEGARSA